jgi:RNA polymerase sigma-70 factor (ECF subfamily)
LTRYKSRLRRVVAFRFDPRPKGRFDASDVMQEMFLAALNSLPDYLSRAEMPVFRWLRGIAGNKLMESHRFHLGTPMRGEKSRFTAEASPRPSRRRWWRACRGN